MSGGNSVRRFEYRRPRISTGFPVDFVAEGETVRGLCTDVSDDGVRAEFDGAMIRHGAGLLILRAPVGTLKLNAVVAYLEKHAVGFIFHFETPWERKMTTQFIATIADRTGPSLVVRIP